MICGLEFIIERRTDGRHWIMFADLTAFPNMVREREANYAECLLWAQVELQTKWRKEVCDRAQTEQDLLAFIVEIGTDLEQAQDTLAYWRETALTQQANR